MSTSVKSLAPTDNRSCCDTVFISIGQLQYELEGRRFVASKPISNRDLLQVTAETVINYSLDEKRMVFGTRNLMHEKNGT